MKSIRRNLTIWLLGGLSLILVAAGAGIYVAVRTSLIKAVDAEMAVDMQLLRNLGKAESEPSFAGKGFPKGIGKGPGKGPSRRVPADRKFLNKIPAYDDLESGSFYQSWDGDGKLDEKSASLGERNLPKIERTTPDPTFAFDQLDNGTPVRLLSFKVAPGGKGRPKGDRRRPENGTTIVIARDMEATEKTLSTLLGGLIAVGFVAGLGTFALVGTAVNRGLKPLRGLGTKTREINSNSLDFRFDDGGAPAELLPVYDRLNDLLARIESSFERERRFSSDLAHEMRTPVAELKTMAEVALQWPEKADTSTHQESLDIAQQLESMIENLLALARWESGELSLRPEQVSLKEAAEKSWEPHAKKAEERNLEVEFDVTDEAALRTDPGMLRHIFDNLFSNAVEYTNEGGRIEVEAQGDRFEITNSANGITEEEVGQFFDRCWRRDPSRSDSAEHSGLGLSLARACAKALNLSLSARLEDSKIRFSLFPDEKMSPASS